MTPATAGAIALAVGLAATLAAWLVDRRRRAYTDLATTPAAAVFAGRNEVKGRAWVAQPTLAHRTRTPAIWWSYTLEEERRHTRTVTSTDSEGRSTSRTETYEQWHEIDAKRDSVATFEVVDASGSVTVRLGDAKVVPEEVLRDVFDDDGDDGRGFLGRLFDNRTGRYRETEEVVAVGDQLFVVGEASLDPQEAVPVLGGRPLVTTRSEASHTSRLGAAALLLALVAAGGTGTGLAVLISGDELRPVGVAVGIAVPLLAALVAWTVTTYNRLHLLEQSIGRAWSLLDVQLARRHDLVPALGEVVRAHAAHERSLLVAVADRGAPERGWDPGRARGGSALSDEAQVQTAALRQLLAVAEAHPELTADAAFGRLQHALADTEGRIAGSRTFYNDTLTLLRDLAQSFPAVLVARFLHLERHELLDAKGFERTVPAIERTFA
jgi:hypothetical protein